MSLHSTSPSIRSTRSRDKAPRLEEPRPGGYLRARPPGQTGIRHGGRGETMGKSEPGKLRIYLGSAAGVGKTYAMLCEGHRRAERGTDVVIGFVETHGREHTAELIEGLEVVPRARLPYRGTFFEEMDLGAVLARKPQVALVDELAHTNVPGARNEKRWQDVEELLG